MANFNYAVCYQVNATCQSPLRTGGPDGAVLIGSDGLPMIQGSSIAGVLRGYLTAVQGTDAACHLFGSAAGEADSILTVSDGSFAAAILPQIRTRLRMDHRTGAAEEGKLFQIDGIPSGTTFSFQLLLQLERAAEERAEYTAPEEKMVETLLQAMHSGAITLGAQRSNGFGVVMLQVQRQRYDLTDEADRTAWIHDCPPKDTVPLPLPAAPQQAISFVLTGQMPSVFLCSGRRERVEGKSVALPMQEQGCCLLPGSALKGCIRAQAERIAAYLGQEAWVTTLFGAEAVQGSFSGTAAKVRVRECLLKQAKQERIITRTRINRFTGGTMDRKLFALRPLSDRVTIQVDLIRPTTPQERGLLFYALRDLAAGLYQVGSGGSVGYGYLTDGTLTVQDGERTCAFHYADHRQTVTGEIALVEPWLKAAERGDV